MFVIKPKTEPVKNSNSAAERKTQKKTQNRAAQRSQDGQLAIIDQVDRSGQERADSLTGTNKYLNKESTMRDSYKS
jgi:hypothetical protein